MQMTNDEIVRRYKQAAKKREQIKILAELNACPKENIRQILREAGCEVPATGNRYTAQAKAAKAMMTASEEAEADGSERKQTEVGELKTEPTENIKSENENIKSEIENLKSERENIKSENENAAAPTACQPAKAVDVWEDEAGENLIKKAKRELAEVEDSIQITKAVIQVQKFNLEKDENRKAFLQEWIQRHEGGTEA